MIGEALHDETLHLPVHSNELTKTRIPDFDIPSCSRDERERRWIVQRTEHGVIVGQFGIFQLLVVELDQLQESDTVKQEEINLL